MASRTGLIAAAIVIIIVVAAAALLAARGGAPSTTSATSPTGGGGGGAASPSATTTTQTAAGGGKEITLNIGLLVDKSGPTSGVGRPYAKGAEAAFKYFNEKGVYTKDGVRVKLNYIERDYGYNPTRAQQYYKEFRDRYGVVAIVGWGTADTEQLSHQVAKDHILYISASYSAKLVRMPYNFFPAPDYSTQACAAVTWMAEKKPHATLVLLYDHTV
jgi:branched-chain amino acid transport system substrate-binding protein